MSQTARIQLYFTNHSLRATMVTHSVFRERRDWTNKSSHWPQRGHQHRKLLRKAHLASIPAHVIHTNFFHQHERKYTSKSCIQILGFRIKERCDGLKHSISSYCSTERNQHPHPSKWWNILISNWISPSWFCHRGAFTPVHSTLP